MKYLFACETYDRVYADARPLFGRASDELRIYKDMPLDVDYDLYRFLYDRKQLVVYTVRTENEDLIGYAIYILRNHTHYRTVKWAVNDAILIVPEHRNAGAGGGLLDFVEQDLKARGVVVMQTMTKARHPALAALLSSRGHELAETIHTKRLG